MVKNNGNEEKKYRYYFEIINSLNIGTWEWEPQTGKVAINNNWASMLGYTIDELEPIDINSWYSLVHPDDLIKLKEELDKVFYGEADIYTCECRIRHKSGDWLWVKDTGKVIDYDHMSKPIKMIGTYIDISELKKTQEDLSIINNELIDSIKKYDNTIESLKRFYSILSHEIKSPVNSIIGYSYMLKNIKSDFSNSELIVDNIAKSSEQLARIVEDIVQISKIETGIASIKKEPLDLRDLIYDLRLSYTNKIKEKGLQFLTYQKLNFEGFLDTDVNRIKQIIENLLNNAIKNTKFGEITLEVNSSISDHNEVTTEIVVSDTGVGIEESKLKYIFDPYYQAQEDRMNDSLGLGLYISKKIAEKLDGEIKVSSSYGKGSKFTLKFKSNISNKLDPSGLKVKEPVNKMLYLNHTNEKKHPIVEVLINSGYDTKVIDSISNLYTEENLSYGKNIVINYDIIESEDIINISRFLSVTNNQKKLIILYNSIAGEVHDIIGQMVEIDLIHKPFHPNELLRTLKEDRIDNNNKLSVEAKLIPKESLKDLRNSIESGDILRIESVINDIGNINKDVEIYLSNLLAQYDYKAIEIWLDKFL